MAHGDATTHDNSVLHANAMQIQSEADELVIVEVDLYAGECVAEVGEGGPLVFF